MSVAIAIDSASPMPPYEQIRDQVVRGVADRQIPVGTRLPTVRRLAEDLGLAVNTVAKAYRHLEAEGHVETRGRNGTVVLPRRADPAGEGGPGGRGDETSAAAAAFARSARRSGLGIDEAVGLLRQAW